MNLNKANLLWAVAGGLGGGALVLIGSAVTYGELRADVSGLKDRVGQLERHGDLPASISETGKGDLCLKLITSLEEAYRRGDATTSEDVKEQLMRLKCYDGVPAASVPDNQVLGHDLGLTTENGQ